MKNWINWFEIPAKDFNRAVSFYRALLEIEVHESEMYGTKMGLFPSDGTNVSGAIVEGEDYEPATKGVLIYLNGGDDLQNILGKVELNSGKILVPKTRISPEMGYFALFMDSEGNKIAIHSMN